VRTQATLAAALTVQGPGLHSGESTRLSLEPAPPGHGIVFLRADLEDPVPIPALLRWAVPSQLATDLEREGQRVRTVEHLLAALTALGFDNLLVRCWGPEVPVLDGSARPWVRLLLQARRRHQGEPSRGFALREPLEIMEGPRRARCVPAPGLFLDVAIDFPHPLLRQRRMAVELGSREFEREISWARTFALQDQAEAMRAAGLARGGTLDNAVVLGPAGVLNPGGLRGVDEPLRHKLLDLVGDLALLGGPLQARIRVEQPGHAFNRELVQALLRACEEVA
jgi:UDP-3-O-[3-hydroxymyristoyl] N-acetylglucosamine deacetylase